MNSISTAQAATSTDSCPELQTGDRLTRAEFERRYEAMPQLKKAELIEGVVYMPSPVTHSDHGRPHFRLIGWLFTYQTATPGTDGGDNSTIRLDRDNEPQPDAFLRVLPELGGQTWPDGRFIGGAPELVAEVAASSVSYDLHDKLNAYRRNGVREYIVWRVQDQVFDWFALQDDRFVPLPAGEDAVLRSRVFPGLWLDAEALVSGDMPRLMQVAQQGIDSNEHAEFVRNLETRRSTE